MTRRLAVPFLLLVLAGTSGAADWKAELMAYLGPRQDFAGAFRYLKGQAAGLEGADRQTADALLAFLASKTGDRAVEEDLVADYYEKYTDNDPEFGFLDEMTIRAFLVFWGRWKAAYPLASDMNFLSPASVRGPAPLPAVIEVGMELLNDAYYRISLGPYTLEGGFWPRGFHILTIPVSDMLHSSGNYDFVLDLKRGDLIVRRTIRIAVEVAGVAAASPVPRPALTVENSYKSPPTRPEATGMEGQIDLYVGDKLILRSKKLAVVTPPINIPIPGPSMANQKPYMPTPKTGPLVSGVSILDALALTYKTLKDLLAKKPPKPSPPVYQKVTTLEYAFSRTDADGAPSEARAVVKLNPSRGSVLRE